MFILVILRFEPEFSNRKPLISGTLTDHAKGVSRKVAIKIPKVSCLQLHREELADFYREAQVSIAIEHKNVLQCLGIAR